MRRLTLGFVVVAAAMFALPATGRGFRVDLTSCGGTFNNLRNIDPSIMYCWDDVPSVIGLQVEFPTDNKPATQFDSALGGGLGEPPASPNPNRFLGYHHHQPSEFFNFNIVAFDYPQFLIDILNPTGAGLIAPQGTITRGLARINDPGHLDPKDDNEFAIPMLRINWLLDFDKLKGYTNIFQPFFNAQTNQDSIGVQLIFYGDNPSFALGLPVEYPVPGVGFEINGLNDTLKYSSSTLWFAGTNGDTRVPCSSFGNDGQPLCAAPAAVPEPSSVALLGLGFLALVVGLRTGRPARMHPA